MNRPKPVINYQHLGSFEKDYTLVKQLLKEISLLVKNRNHVATLVEAKEVLEAIDLTLDKYYARVWK